MDKTFELLQGLATHYDYTLKFGPQGVQLIGNGGPVFEFDSMEEALSDFLVLLKEDQDRPKNWKEASNHIEKLQTT